MLGDNNMIKYKDSEEKINKPKRTITISNVRISEKEIIDEDGTIIERLLNILPNKENTSFTIKITLELPEVMDLSEDE